jgi:uracil-DNA glycosylase family 4
MTFDEPNKNCNLCPRLHKFLLEKRIEFPDYHNSPVPSFGDKTPKLLIIGLAPGMHGANKTGRPFTGDWAGDLLFSALKKYGFTRGKYGGTIDDGLELIGARITNAVRCVPPQNKPIGIESKTCRKFLINEIDHLSSVKAILCLGKISHDNTVRALNLKLSAYKFSHHAINKLDNNKKLFSSYHCSRYNTNTKRLTEEMFFSVFESIRGHINI